MELCIIPTTSIIIILSEGYYIFWFKMAVLPLIKYLLSLSKISQFIQ